MNRSYPPVISLLLALALILAPLESVFAMASMPVDCPMFQAPGKHSMQMGDHASMDKGQHQHPMDMADKAAPGDEPSKCPNCFFHANAVISPMAVMAAPPAAIAAPVILAVQAVSADLSAEKRPPRHL